MRLMFHPNSAPVLLAPAFRPPLPQITLAGPAFQIVVIISAGAVL